MCGMNSISLSRWRTKLSFNRMIENTRSARISTVEIAAQTVQSKGPRLNVIPGPVLFEPITEQQTLGATQITALRCHQVFTSLYPQQKRNHDPIVKWPERHNDLMTQ